MTTESKTIISRTAPLLEYLNKKRQDQRLTKTVEIAFTLIFVSFFVIAAIRPALITISALLGEIKSKEVLTKGMKNKIGQVMQAQDAFSEVQEKYLVIETVLPTDPNYNTLAAQILGSTSDSNTQITQISFDVDGSSKQTSKNSAPVNTSVKDYQVDYNINSDFSSGLRFLDTINNIRRLVSIPEITITLSKDPKNNSANINSLIYNIKMHTYYWNEK